MSNFKTMYNRDKFPAAKKERNRFPSMTIPGQAMSMTEILNRHKAGLSLTGNKVTFYQEQEDELGMTNEEFRKLDLAEQQEIIEQRKDELEQLNQKRRKAEKDLREKEQAEQAKKVEEARQAYVNKLRELGKPVPPEDDSTNLP